MQCCPPDCVPSFSGSELLSTMPHRHQHEYQHQHLAIPYDIRALSDRSTRSILHNKPYSLGDCGLMSRISCVTTLDIITPIIDIGTSIHQQLKYDLVTRCSVCHKRAT